MSSFTSELKVSPMPDGKFFKVLRDFTYRIGSRYSRYLIRVRRGELTDFASVPKFIRPLLPEWAKINKSSVLHDIMYRHQRIMGEPITRKFADDTWCDAMLIEFACHKLGKFVAYLEYITLRLVGWKAWNDYGKSLKKTG